MKNLQPQADKLSITLSTVCAIHCLLVPLLVSLAPSLAVLNLEDEKFHFWMIIGVIPSSIYALTLGCKKHERYQLLLLGLVGLFLLVMALIVEDIGITVVGEQSLTLAGATLLAVGHWFNFRLCVRRDCN